MTPASKNNGLYTPTERLAFVRSLFFPQNDGGQIFSYERVPLH